MPFKFNPVTGQLDLVDTPLVSSVNGFTGAVNLITTNIPEGTNLYYTDARVSSNSSVALNTAKVSADGSINTHSDVTTGTPTNSDVLTWNSTTSQWEAVAVTNFDIGSNITGTDGSLLFIDAGVLAEDNANLFWDNTNNRLGIGTNTPDSKLHVKGVTHIDSLTTEKGIIMQGDKVAFANDIEIKDTSGRLRLAYNNTGGVNSSFGGTNLLVQGGEGISILSQSNGQGLTVIYNTAIENAVFGSRYTVTSSKPGGKITGFSGELIPTGNLAKATCMFGQFLAFNAVTVALEQIVEARIVLAGPTITDLFGYVGFTGFFLSGTTVTNQVTFEGKNAGAFGGVVQNKWGMRLADVNTGTVSNFAIQTNAGNIVFNENGDINTDFRVEGDTDQHLLFTDAGVNSVGIGKSLPLGKLHIASDSTTKITNIIEAKASQSVNMTEWRSSVGTALTTINQTGGLTGNVNSTANNNLIWNSNTIPSILKVDSANDRIESNNTHFFNGSEYKKVVTKTAIYTATNTDNIILANTTTSSYTITLPTAASSFSTNVGQVITIKHIGTGSNILTIDGNGVETIDGSLTISSTIKNESFSIISDGTSWHII